MGIYYRASGKKAELMGLQILFSIWKMIQDKLKGILMKVCGSMDESMVMGKRLGPMMPDLKEIMKMIRNMAKVFCF